MSLKLAFETLYAVGDLQPVGVSDLSRNLGAPKSSVHRELRKLQEIGWVSQNSGTDANKWALTPAPLRLAQKVAGDSNLKAVAIHEMQALQERYEEAVHLAIPEGRGVVIVERLECPKPIRIHWPVGNNAPLHASANGRAILAFSTGSQYESLLPTSFEPLAEKTVKDLGAFLKDIDKVKDQGYAFVYEELRDDIASIAAPIMGERGEPVASLSIFLPSYRVPADVEAVGREVMQAARRISRGLIFN